MAGGHNFDDLTGQKFFRLTVLERTNDRIYYYEKYKRYFNQTRYLCICDCGNRVECSRTSLKQNKSKSCGCYRNEVSSKRAKEILKNYAAINGKIVKEYYNKKRLEALKVH